MCRWATYEVRIPIAASRERLWASLLDTASWWLPAYRMVPGSKGPFLEARAGGRLYEEGEGDAEFLWFVVTAVVPGTSVDFEGSIAPPGGGPASLLLHLEIEDAEGGASTVLVFRDCMFGNLEEPIVEALHSGWTQLFTEGLKARAESAKRGGAPRTTKAAGRRGRPRRSD
jgi:hypothetical protein